ncbi:unnamed protein product, partial [Adineta ricciae]
MLLSIYFKCYSRYTFYHRNNDQTFDCLYAHIEYSHQIDSGAYLTLSHLIPFCQQFNENDKPNENVENGISFEDLSRNGISSSQLLKWFVPIDIAEEYEINSKHSNEFFYNCSFPWFGSTCQFQLIKDEEVTFGELVRFIFLERDSPSSDLDFPIGTCYLFLKNCIRGPSPVCLDWREICNGVNDCIDGEDEEFCALLEENRCSNEEFQCVRSKECISRTFVNDHTESLDCLDTSDEKEKFETEFGENCIKFPTFECEEIGRGVRDYFSCGDGQIKLNLMPRFHAFCANLRDQHMTKTLFTSFHYISNVPCRKLLMCYIRPDRIHFLSHLPDEIHCELPLEHCPLKWVVFPEYPILYSTFQFVYFTNRSISLSTDDITPDLICFNAIRCPEYVFCSIDIEIQHGLHCCRAFDILYDPIDTWDAFQLMFELIFQNCFKIIQSDTSLSIDENANSSVNLWLNSHKTFPFAHFCDGQWHIRDNDESTETDETNCDLWPCNNPYTRCNQYLHCWNAIDEVNCPKDQCGSDELYCKDEAFQIRYCLPRSFLADDHTKFTSDRYSRVVHLINETIGDVRNYFFWNQTKCLTVEYSNRNDLTRLVANNNDACLIPKHPKFVFPKTMIVMRNKTDLCRAGSTVASNYIEDRPYLQSAHLGYFPSIVPPTSHQSTMVQSDEASPIDLHTDEVVSWYCNRGFAIFYQKNRTIKCLCPPSYFGSRCQWQNQCISLSFQLKYFTFMYEMPIFQVILMLIDDQRQISPYNEQTIHVPKRDCGIKYHFYLLYPSRPKNSSLNYSVQIDIFNRITLTHWA